MPKTRRGGNNPERVRRQKIHNFSKTREELEEMDTGELADLAEELGVLEDVEIDSDLRKTPNSKEIIRVLLPLRNQTIS